jgi:very-short-patch-repair endonuclease
MRAKELRSDLTPAEKLMWSMVRAKRLGGLKFHRQFPIGAYIVDFYCAEKKLIVEIDGETHDYRMEHDSARTEFFEQHGLQVLRFSNEDVLSNLENAGVAILQAAGGDVKSWLEGRYRHSPSPEK